MSPVLVRAFRRSDRDGLAALVNAHVAAVVPGAEASTNAVLAQLEAEPAELVIDPWVVERRALVAELRGRVVAAALLVRYGDDPAVGAALRGAGELRFALFWPRVPAANPAWPDATGAAEALVAACVAQLERWGGRQLADGALPAPGVYGVPEQWPHVRALLERAGFVHHGATEAVLVGAPVRATAAPPPLAGAALARSVGIVGTRLAAVVDGEEVGFVEVAVIDERGRAGRRVSFGDIGDLQTTGGPHAAELRAWLLGRGLDWLARARVDQVLAYADPGDAAELALYAAQGFALLTLTARGWQRPVGAAATAPAAGG